jgi:uncharacterized membrane protein
MTVPEPPTVNPYASPSTVGSTSDPVVVLSSTSSDRRPRRIQDEASLKQNTLCLVGIFSSIAAVMNLMAFSPGSGQPDAALIAMAIMSTFVAVASIVVNFGIRRFASWSRIPLTILAFMSLPIMPLGSAFGILILKTLHLGKPPGLLTPEYEQIVRATPEPKDRTSTLTWLGIILLIVLAIATVLVAQIPPELRQPR